MMPWKGIAIGSFIGSFFGGFPWGAIFGAVLGYKFERFLLGNGERRRSIDPGMVGTGNREMVFCGSAAAMLAKLAKADGRVTSDEIASVERAFQQLGFSSSAREYAIKVFRKAKDDSRSIYDYARDFAVAVPYQEVREFLYGLLWDLACADGKVDANERAILSRITSSLGISSAWFQFYASERLGEGRSSPSGSSNSLLDAYATLGVAQSASNDEVKRAYREKAKKYHPDSLRAQGLPDEMIGKATERMAKINSAWSTIRQARGL